MIRYFFNKILLSMKNRYEYDVCYMQDILQTDLKAFLKLMAFQLMSSHTSDLPAELIFAARLRAILWEDCGPCTQLIINMALEAKVNPSIVRAILDRDVDCLPEDIALVICFTEFVLDHNPEADTLREKIQALWGERALIALTYGISSTRVYPTLKYALGYGETCHRVNVNDAIVLPQRK